MPLQSGREAFKGAIKRFQMADPQPLLIRKMPYAESLHAAIVCHDADRDTLTASFACGPEHLQGAGVVQGGVLAAMLDLAMAFVSLAALPAELTCATSQLNVHDLSPAYPGMFYAHAEVEKSGKRVMFARAELRPAGSEMVASGTAVFAVLSAEGSTVATHN